MYRLIRSTAYELAGDRNQIYCRYVENTQNRALIILEKIQVSHRLEIRAR